MPVWTAIDGTTVNGASPYLIKMREETRYHSEVRYDERIGRGPRVGSVVYNVGEQRFYVERNPRANLNRTDFGIQARRLFSPSTSQARTITGLHEIDETEVTLQVRGYITEFRQIELDLYEGILQMPHPAWRETTEHSESSYPVTVGGNVAAAPVLSVSGGLPIVRHRVSVRDRTGHGLISELVKIPLNLVDRPASRTMIFANGIAQPFTRAGSGSGIGLWLRVDVPPGGTTAIDVYTGQDLLNTTTADALDPAGIDLAASDNDELVYESWSVQEHPLSASSAWHAGRTIKHPTGRRYTFGMNDPDNAGLIQLEPDIGDGLWTFDDNYDSVVLTSSIPITRIEDLDIRVFSGFIDGTPGVCSVQAKYRRRDAVDWTTFQSINSIGLEPAGQWTETTVSEDVPGVHQIAVSLAPHGIQGGASLHWGVLFVEGTPRIIRQAGRFPQITISDPIDARLKDGVIENTSTGERIILHQVYTDDTPLIIDTSGDVLGERGVRPESGPIYRQGIDRTDPANWMPLEPGEHTIDGPFDVALSWRDTWEL